ncbi:hypothetical protein HDK77DRAFT_452237 [Phyllosticta capitalensis]
MMLQRKDGSPRSLIFDRSGLMFSWWHLLLQPLSCAVLVAKKLEMRRRDFNQALPRRPNFKPMETWLPRVEFSSRGICAKLIRPLNVEAHRANSLVSRF